MEGAETDCSEPYAMDYNVSSKVEQRGILAGMLLGVGRRNLNNFSIHHPLSQKPYLLFKKQLLEQITRKPVSLRQRKTPQGEIWFQIQPKLIPLTRVLVKRLYQGTQKQITLKFLKFLTPQGIALWFMDRGTRSFQKRGGKIQGFELFLRTSFSRSENEVIITYFSEFQGLNWGLSQGKKGSRLRIGTQEGRKFLALVSPYIHPSLFYKIQTSYNKTATT